MEKLYANIPFILCTFILMRTAVSAELDQVESIFRENKVKVKKTEVLNGVTTYDVDLPFDPNIGKNSNHLEAELVSANYCQPFAMISRLDKVKIIVSAKMKNKHCIANEQIEALP